MRKTEPTFKEGKRIMKTTSILQMTVRIIGVIELILGVVFWTGNAESLIRVHILLGCLLTLALLGLHKYWQCKCAKIRSSQENNVFNSDCFDYLHVLCTCPLYDRCVE